MENGWSQEGYERLAAAIVLQAVTDYRRMLRRLCHRPHDESVLYEKKMCERFFKRGIERYSNLDGEAIMRAIRERVSKEMKVMVTKETLSRYKQNKRELMLIERQIGKLNKQLAEVPEVSGKVTKSADEWPYIEQHITVQMAEPKAASAIKDKIRTKEARRKKLTEEILGVEAFIACRPEGMEKNILEMVYLEDLSQKDVGEMVGYTQARVSQLLREAVRDL